MHRNILIISDIEGSSGCASYTASSFMTRDWARACVDMSLDVNTVVKALLDTGVNSIIVKDFHRTAYNILPELIDPRVNISCGYKAGPVPGIGDPKDSTAVLMIGMHAPSGSGGFLAHTLTSRIAEVLVNGSLLGEAELFSASLAPYSIAPALFSGCPVACSYAQKAIPGISTFPVIKNDDGSFKGNVNEWRDKLAKAAVESLNSNTIPFNMYGPFDIQVTMRDGETVAHNIALRWRMDHHENTIYFRASDFNNLYLNLARICYLTPFVEKILPAGLAVYDMAGRFGRIWVRHKLKKIIY